MHHERRQVAGHGELAFACHRVVDGVRAGREVRFARAEGVHELVELLQRLGGRQLEHREGLDGGPQPAHGDGGPHSVPGHVADHEGDARAGELDRLVPVAADLDELAARQVPVLDLDGRRIGQPGGEHGALQHQRGGVLSLVPARVVEEDGGTGGELHAHVHVVTVEAAGARLPDAVEEPERGVLAHDRQQQHRHVGQQAGDRLAPPEPG
jgi:hypothetical protein